MFIFPRPLIAVAAGLAVALGMVGLAGLGDTAGVETEPGAQAQAAGHAIEPLRAGACSKTESTPPPYDTGACAWDARWGIVRAGS